MRCFPWFSVTLAGPKRRVTEKLITASSRGNHRASQLLLAVLALPATAGVLGFFASLVAYVLDPGYTDHVEPAIACVASQFFAGMEIYPANETVPPFGLQYGPLTYLPPAIAIALVQDVILGPQLAAALAAGAGLTAIMAAFLRRGPWPLALICSGVLGFWLLLPRQAAYWARPDPYILLAICLAVPAIDLRSRRAASIAAGLLCGIAVGFKIHAFLSFLPLIGLILHRDGWRAAPVVAVTAAGVACAPFALTNVSLAGFAASIGIAVKHGFSASQFLSIGGYACVMLVPLVLVSVALLARDRPALTSEVRGHWIFWAAFPFVLLLVVFLGSKRGAGTGHLVPVMPLIAVATFRLSRILAAIAHPGGWRFLLWVSSLAIYAVALSALAFRGQQPVWSFYTTNPDIYPALRQDLDKVLRRFGHLKLCLGFDSGDNYLYTTMRPVLVNMGHPYLIEPVALMDLQAAGFEVYPAKALDPREVDMWLIPKGGPPFSAINGYGTGPMLPESFQRQFAEDWTKAGESGAYNLYVHRNNTGVLKEP